MGRKKNKSAGKIQFENELLKLKLSAETGAQFHSNEADNFMPEMENAFLKNVIAFEEAFKNSRQVRVFDMIGKPEFKSFRSLKKNEVSLEIEKLLDLYNINGIAVDCINDVSEKDFYIFITKELPFVETDEIKLPGFTTHFTYEEFHPNDEADIRNVPFRFLWDLFNKENEQYSHHLYKTFSIVSGKSISKIKLIKALNNFRGSFEKFSRPKVEITSLQFTKKKASIESIVFYKAYTEIETIKMDGPASFKLHKDESGYWDICSFKIPGLVI